MGKTKARLRDILCRMLLLLAVNGTITGGLSAVSTSAMHSRHGLAQRQADALHFVEAGLRVFLMHSARERTAEWHPRDETYQAALACLVDAIHAHPFTALWGDGETSSSDGQFFRAGGHGEARADHNAHYGSECQSANYLRVTEGYLRMKYLVHKSIAYDYNMTLLSMSHLVNCPPESFTVIARMPLDRPSWHDILIAGEYPGGFS